MNIGGAAKKSGLPAKTIRLCEDIGLVEPQARRANGYRDFDQRDLHELRFVARARSLGDLFRDRSRASADVETIARARVVTSNARSRS